VLRKRAVAAGTVSVIALLGAGVVSATPAFANVARYLYVDNTSSACTDSGSGSSTAPFCTIQAAANKVAAGDAIDVVAGTYTSPTTITVSGTAAAPIQVIFQDPPSAECTSTSSPVLRLPVGSTRSAITVSNASYVEIEDPCIWGASTGAAISLQNSTQILVEDGSITTQGDAIDVSGSGVGDVIERMFLNSATGTDVAVSSAADVTITTNRTDSISDEPGSQNAAGITVSGSSDTDIVSNTIEADCQPGVSVSGASDATVMENNVITDGETCGSGPIGLSVAADSAQTFQENYDSIAVSPGDPVDWAGTLYQSASTFHTATGQGANDYLGDATTMYANYPQYYVDDADANAQGELATDFSGEPRADDPNIANTGTGVGYYDRGAEELQSAVLARFASVDTVGGRGITITSSPVAPCGTWGSTYTATLHWGDGQSTVQTGKSCNNESVTATHTYAGPGSYTMTLTVTDGYGASTATQIAMPAGLDFTSYGPTRILDTRNGTGVTKAKVAPGGYVKVKVAGTGSIPADAQAVALNLTATNTGASGYAAAVADGSGTPSTSNLNFGSGQTVANSTVVQLSSTGYIDIYNGSKASSIDLIADVTGYFTPTAAAGYDTVTPDRILDTRNGTGAAQAQIGSGSAVPVGIVGVDGIPASATAVAVHVTVTNTRGGGFAAAVPDGSGKPTTSSMNFGAGQTVSNTVIVPIAADGKIELYNGATGPVDLIADVAGYFTASSSNVFVPVAPTRVVDTRASSSPLKSDSTNYFVTGTNKDPGTVAVVANLTATQPTAGGNLQAFPTNTTRPGVSNVNFGPGQTVANLALLTNNASTGADTDVYNDSPGTTQLIIDVFGYFTSK
jgi:hypothetical protein